ncbi:hypothetical protein BRADO0483 [Bradyrhizobium sp. ORS 278]|nr:hypothetical protein BRADO0483 [Bradyrhizobium sp. ORS 278]
MMREPLVGLSSGYLVQRPELVGSIGLPCLYCGKPMENPTRDHVHRSRSKGGKLEPGNKAIVCERCNMDKGSRSLASWLVWLQRSGDCRASVVGQLVLDRQAKIAGT